MTLDQIETFLAVADEGSFKAASEVLHRSQPALSMAVKKLEEELGIALFNREQYRPILTPQGRAFHQRCQKFYAQAKSLESFGKQLGMGEEPEISLAIDSAFPLDIVLAVLDQFSQAHGETRLNISFEILGGASDKLIEGEVDMALGPRLEARPFEFTTHPLLTVNMVPCISRLGLEKNKLKIDDKGKGLTLEDLRKIPQIIVKDSSSKPSIKNYGVLGGGKQWGVHDLGTKKEIIQKGLGWGRLPRHTVAKEIDKGELLVLSLPGLKEEALEMILLINEKRPLGPLSRKLKDIFIEKSSPAEGRSDS